MLWVCRAGVNSRHLESFINNKRIYLPWKGYKVDLRQFESREQFRDLVCTEKGDVSRTSISNWSGQLYSFSREMSVGDFVVIPGTGSRSYSLARIVGEYEFDASNKDQLWHSHKIKMILNCIPRDQFSQSLQYSLGAYRTVFKIKNEAEFLLVAKQYKSKMETNKPLTEQSVV